MARTGESSEDAQDTCQCFCGGMTAGDPLKSRQGQMKPLARAKLSKELMKDLKLD